MSHESLCDVAQHCLSVLQNYGPATLVTSSVAVDTASLNVSNATAMLTVRTTRTRRLVVSYMKHERDFLCSLC